MVHGDTILAIGDRRGPAAVQADHVALHRHTARCIDLDAVHVTRYHVVGNLCGNPCEDLNPNGRGPNCRRTGGIHTDLARGFIRAETIAYDDYIRCGGEAGARDAGKLRSEGKEYVVQDGDVLLFRFNV